jgi:UDP-N-acetylmuramate dehydrogenase
MGERLLSELTTLRLGGPAKDVVEAGDEQDLVDTVAATDATGDPLLVVAGGSNLVLPDAPIERRVVLVRTTGLEVDSHDDRVVVRVAAGEDWDSLVARAVADGWVGVEALSGIPGSVGATPIQNVGAYGQEVSDTLSGVRVWDRLERQPRTLVAAECGFGYRTSRFKAEPDRFLVLEVAFTFARGDLGAPIRYAQLADRLGVDLGARVPLAAVRDAVLELRRSKGMVLDAADHDTWSAGSFFTNPLLDPTVAGRLPADAPRWPQPDGRVKTSSAWLIERAGFARGHGAGAARISTKHTLALTNRGTATTAELLALAREVREGVSARFGVELVTEPTLVDCAL